MTNLDGRLPAEILLCIFKHLNGPSLAACAKVCRHWAAVVNGYDDVIWSNCALRDFERPKPGRFWSPIFPEPEVYNSIGQTHQRTWQDMYRITHNWFTGNCSGYFPRIHEDDSDIRLDGCFPQAVVGTPQEHTFFTTLTVTSTGHIMRSNPTYRRSDGSQTLMVMCPRTRDIQYFSDDLEHQEEVTHNHTIFCHYSHPTSNWVVTGSLDGTIALWDTTQKLRTRLWIGHRGRVLCVGMNNEVVVSGGSDNMLRVWELNTQTDDIALLGVIDISDYLFARSDWYQGVGELSVNGNLVACAPDASGPILVFSILTGALVYELGKPRPSNSEFFDTDEEVITGFTKLCLTPYFLLVKGKVPSAPDDIPTLPTNRPRHSNSSSSSSSTSLPAQPTHRYGYVATLNESTRSQNLPSASMTPYQLYLYYQNLHATDSIDDTSAPPSHSVDQVAETSTTGTRASQSCINVYSMHSGKLVYRLVPRFDSAETGYVITDIRTSIDFSKVFACLELRNRHHREEKLYCWDMASFRKQDTAAEESLLKVIHLDGQRQQLESISHHREAVGNSWACFM